ncbi:hypothetical protein LCGC14_1591360 [marine sediment metagenome]|uniref:Uncharacterized protein n=1 Tax=marine sediment metagenome TaxID=412755 RepID=A0A0F9LEA1_9ZZZZ
MAEDEEAQAETAEADVESLKTRNEELTAQLASALTEAKGHQKRAEKNKGEASRLDKIEKHIEVLTGMTAETLDKDEFGEKRRSDTYLNRLKESDEQRVKNQLMGADRRLKEIGLDMQSSDETQRAYNKYLLGDMDGCLDEVDRLIEGKKAEASKSKETDKSSVEEQVEERVRQKMQQLNLLDTDTGGPQGAGGKVFTTKEIDKMNIKEYREKFPSGYGDVLKAIQEGRIKE